MYPVVINDTVSEKLCLGLARVLVIGAGGLALWAVKLLKAMYPEEQIKIVVADINVGVL